MLLLRKAMRGQLDVRCLFKFFSRRSQRVLSDLGGESFSPYALVLLHHAGVSVRSPSEARSHSLSHRAVRGAAAGARRSSSAGRARSSLHRRRKKDLRSPLKAREARARDSNSQARCWYPFRHFAKSVGSISLRPYEVVASVVSWSHHQVVSASNSNAFSRTVRGRCGLSLLNANVRRF